MSVNYRGKAFRLGWGAAYDSFQYHDSPIEFEQVWTLMDAGSVVVNKGQDFHVPNLRGDDFVLTITNNTGSAKDVFYSRTFTGLIPSTTYTIRSHCLVRLVVGASCGIRVGVTTAFVPIDNSWHLTEITATSDASGAITVQLVALGVPTATTNMVIAWGPVLLDIPLYGATPFDEAVAYSEPRPGSSTAQIQSGEEDAWTTGHDYFFEGTVRWIPPQTIIKADGSKITGWNDPTGWSAALRWARDKRPLILYPNKDDTTIYYPCLLVEPMKGAPPLESDFTRQLKLKLRSIGVAPEFVEIMEI